MRERLREKQSNTLSSKSYYLCSLRYHLYLSTSYIVTVSLLASNTLTSTSKSIIHYTIDKY